MIKDKNAEVFCQPTYDRNNSLQGKVRQERIVFDDRTQMNADNHDFKYNELTDGFIMIFYRVYNKLGYGFLENVYEIAMVIELNFGTKPEVKRKAFDSLK